MPAPLKVNLPARQLAVLYGETGTVRKLAERLGVAPKTAHAALTRAGISTDRSVRPPRVNLSAEQLARRYQAAGSIRGVAAQLGVGTNTARRALASAGVPINPGRKPTSIDVDQVVALYRGAESMREVADHLGVHLTTVLRALDRAGVPRKPRRSADLDVGQVVALYGETKSMGLVAERLGVNITAVRRALDRAGIPRKRGRTTHLDVDQVVALYRETSSIVLVAERFGVHYNTVRTVLINAGAYTPQPRRPRATAAHQEMKGAGPAGGNRPA